ncbi:MAG: Ni/Fe hydrogenase subunit alpha [Acidimicrobiales bacterium]|jgi:NAD-reducing hydrogenase large subunit
MSQIIIEPVTRIEGHSKISIQLDERGEVVDAHFHVTQFRGFERISQGRPFHEMPALMARICGICPVSHLIASAKACEDLMAVTIPPTATSLRKVMNLAQMVQSHALSFFHLSSPDLLLGFDGAVASRNILGVAEAAPQMALDGVAMRKFGQQIIERLGGKRVHPGWIVPGGVSHPLQPEIRDEILAAIPDALDRVRRTLAWYKENVAKWADEASVFANFPSLYMGLVAENGDIDFSDGNMRVIDAEGKRLADDVDPKPYWDYIGEAVEPWSYLKSTYWKDLGYPGGLYRVGPLARLNVIDQMGTPEADEELGQYREKLGRYPSSSFYYHHARLIEMLHCVHSIKALLSDPEILNDRVRAVAGANRAEGVGVSEAPRGVLIHHYQVDKNGLMERANLIIATGHNNMAMNRGVLEVAKKYVNGTKIEEPMLNRVEAVIRCFDPCLSCSTHAIGQMPLEVQLLSADGQVLDQLAR